MVLVDGRATRNPPGLRRTIKRRRPRALESVGSVSENSRKREGKVLELHLVGDVGVDNKGAAECRLMCAASEC